MYIKNCGYGRSKRCRTKIWTVLSTCILVLGMCGLTIHVMAGQTEQIREWNFDSVEINGALVTEMTHAEETVTVKSHVEMISAETAVEEVAYMPADAEKPLIVIDPGHGGEDEGCAHAGVEEKSVNLQIGLSLRDKLEEMGYEVLMTREIDEAVTLEERARLANEASADIYVSIHQNSCEDSSVSGIETWYNSSKSGNDSKRLAQLIHNDVVLYGENNDRGLWEDETLYVIRETDMPSCLVETGFLSNSGDRKALLEDNYRDRIVEGIASGIDLYFHPKTMYLTFDDGPSPENTEKILDILKEKNIKATFFVIGENVRKNPEIAKRIVEEGHTIGIHCDWHDYDKLYSSVDDYVADFEKAYQTVYEITGVKTTLFRFPGGSINSYNKDVYQDIIEKMTKKGFVYYDWNASLEDAVTKSIPEKLIQNAKESTLGRKKIIMLAHDTVDDTVLCLEELIEQFPEYQMEPLTAEVEPIQF